MRGILQKKAFHYHQGQLSSTDYDWVAEEVPVALIYNGISHAVMMATPLNLEQFAVGFSLSERIIKSVNDIYHIEVQRQAQGIEVHIEISSRRFMALKEKRRALTGRTGCGICGTEQLAEVFTELPILPFTTCFKLTDISTTFTKLVQSQVLRSQTGGTHVAGWFTSQGQLLCS